MMIDTKALRQKVLDLAIRGKLTEQDENDEPASKLIERIKAEKEQLVKEKKIKKEKQLPPIAEEEIPFETPENWEWVRLGEVLLVLNGDRGKNYPSKSKLKTFGIPFINAGNIDENNLISEKSLLYVSEAQFDLLKAGKLKKDDEVLCIRGSLGKHGTFKFESGAIASSLVILRKFCDFIYQEYINKYFDSLFFCYEIKKYDNGSAQPNLAAADLKKVVLPLPPLEEQKRIVAKIDQLFKEIDTIEKAQNELSELKKLAKQKILDLAIRGKLVEQDMNDHSIINEISKKGVRVEETETFLENYTLPSNWVILQLKSIGTIIGGGTPKTNDSANWIDGSIPWLTPADLSDYTEKYISKGSRNITDIGLKNSSARLLPKGTLLYSSRAPIGHLAIAKNEICTNQGFKSIVPFEMEMNEYLYYAMIYRTPYIQSQASGTTFKEISGKGLGLITLPIPPLEEQKRIVAKINQFFEEIDCIE